MRRDTSKTAGELERPKGNSLLENYDLHDEGERELVRRIEALGLVVEPWGIDMRHEDGSDGIIYDSAMDFKVYAETDGQPDAYSVGGTIVPADAEIGVVPSEPPRPLKLVALVDVKTKSNPRYMGRFNLRHLRDYQEHAMGFNAPVFVVMFQVDKHTGEVQDEFVYHVAPDDTRYISSEDGSIKTFPDGNHAALIKHEAREPWGYLVSQLWMQR